MEHENKKKKILLTGRSFYNVWVMDNFCLDVLQRLRPNLIIPNCPQRISKCASRVSRLRAFRDSRRAIWYD